MDVVILAGGASRRMGRDKATVDVGGQRLVDVVTDRLAPIAHRVVIARGARPTLEHGREVDDVEWAGGPIAGVVAGLADTADDLIAIVAVDMPHVSAAVLSRLAELCRRHDRSACVPVVDGMAQPLHAVVTRAGAAALTAVAEQGERSLRRAFGRIDALAVDIDGWGDVDPVAAFATDLDTPADLARARRTTGS